MSAIPLEDAISRGGAPSEARSKLPPKALLYFFVVVAGAVAVTTPFLSQIDRHTGSWIEFAILATSVAFAQFFVVRTPGNKSYHTTGVFLIASVLLLPPGLVALIPLIQHVPEWLRSRGKWYVQSTNLCVYTIATMAAWGSAHLILGADGLLQSDDVRFALAGTGASVVFVVLNSALLAPMIRFVNGHPMRLIFSYQTLSTEFVFAALGVVLAAFWTGNPWLVPFAIAPLLLIHRALSVPQLQAEARVDPKTGLFNARYFASALTEELGRAQRFERPLSLIMADLDLLREINNTYGHLAGDAVLKGIAEVFRAELRHYDVPARFGGEEFSILLPETPPEQALEIAERIRRAIAERLFDVETSSEPIRATVSIGVASFPKDAQDPNALIHQADLAVYRAKLQGRNRVLTASSEPLLMPADRSVPLVSVPEDGDHHEPLARVPEAMPELERRHTAHTTSGPRFLQLSTRLRPPGRPRDDHRRHGGRDGRPPRYLDRHHRPARGDRARRRGGGARARARRRLDLRQRCRCARGRGPLRPPECARSRGRHLRRPVERGSRPDPQGALQRRHADTLVARGGVRLHARLRR